MPKGQETSGVVEPLTKETNHVVYHSSRHIHAAHSR
jgi:hypothetical protein